MDRQQAREILMRHRPGTTDATDLEFTEALETARHDPELGRWFEQHQAFQNSIRDRLRQMPVPQGLKERILAGHRPDDVVVWWRQPGYQLLAAAAALALLVGLGRFWNQSSEDKSFSAFRNRIVRNAQRGYVMDITSTNLADIRRYLATQGARSDYVLSSALEKLPGDGGAVVRWQNKKVSMVCFDLGKHRDLYLFVASQSDLPDAPPIDQPMFATIGKLTTASWSSAGTTYVLAGPGDEQFIRGYLR